MRPEWFSPTNKETETTSTLDESLPPIPYDSIWLDDVLWMPPLLAKHPFVGRADLNADSSGRYKTLMVIWRSPDALVVYEQKRYNQI